MLPFNVREVLIKRIPRSFASGLMIFSFVCHSRNLLSGNPGFPMKMGIYFLILDTRLPALPTGRQAVGRFSRV
jgi:hypothetical protein